MSFFESSFVNEIKILNVIFVSRFNLFFEVYIIICLFVVGHMNLTGKETLLVAKIVIFLTSVMKGRRLTRDVTLHFACDQVFISYYYHI